MRVCIIRVWSILFFSGFFYVSISQLFAQTDLIPESAQGFCSLALQQANQANPRAEIPFPWYIQGEWFTPPTRDSQVRKIVNPATLEPVGFVADAPDTVVDTAVNVASVAFPGWSGLTAGARAEYLDEIAHHILDEKFRIELARLMVLETGKPYAEAWDEVGWTGEAFKYYAGLIRHFNGEALPPMASDQINFTQKIPYGVAAVIVPFNFPLLLMSWHVAPALAAGNTVVLKAPHQNPLTSLLIAKAFKNLPKGVFNVITGDGITGQNLVKHPQVSVIGFTGSTEAGKKVQQLVAGEFKALNLELGGLDPLLVLNDADLNKSISNIVWARGLCAGQVCTSPKRIIVVASIYQKFIKLLVRRVKKLKVGDPRDPDTDIGPLISSSARDKVYNQVRTTLDQGGNLLYGGNKIQPNGLPGFFFEPTIIEITSDMLPAQEEVFGPVYSVIRVTDKEEAFKIAEAVPYKLGASVFTTSIANVIEATKRLGAGTLWFNKVVLDDNVAGPFGGDGATGGGRVLGLEGLNRYQRTQAVYIAPSGKRTDEFPYSQREVPGAWERK